MLPVQLAILPLETVLFEPLVALALGVCVAGADGGLAAVHEEHLVALETAHLLDEARDLGAEAGVVGVDAGAVGVGGDENAADARGETMVLFGNETKVGDRYIAALGIGNEGGGCGGERQLRERRGTGMREEHTN